MRIPPQRRWMRTSESGHYASLVSGGASADSCVVERNGGDAFTDAPATVGNRLNAITTVPPNGNYSCPGNDVFPLSEDKAQLRAKIDALTAGGGTAGHIGAAWGWYMVSPNWGSLFPRGSRGRSYSDKSVIKSVLLMTDGEFNTSYQAAGQNSTDRAIIGSSPYQALALCDSMKRQGIEVWTIGFQASPAAENLLRDCATDGGHFISAVDTTSLRAAFLEVARRLTALRLSN